MAVAPVYTSLLPAGKQVHVVGDWKESVLKGVVGAADTYVTGGFALPVPNGANTIAAVSPVVFGSGHYGSFNPATGLMQVFSASGTELVNASAALQNVVFIITISGV
jgi:hypothetical protein